MCERRRIHFGIGQRRAYTVEEIGRRYRLIRARSHQIELKALKKLCHLSWPLNDFATATPLRERPRASGEISVDGSGSRMIEQHRSLPCFRRHVMAAFPKGYS